jgi:3-oxoacyl-[acyl-carrier protein] reductase
MSTNASKLAGKVAVVTGASKGIGAAIAKQLAADGATVVVNYATSQAGAEKVINEIAARGGKAIAVQGDMAKKEDVTKLFAETKKVFGHLDILVNNAGIYEFSPLENITEESFHKHFNLNVLGLIMATQTAAQFFNGSGAIINISSIVATGAFPGSTVYSATKAAVDSITRTLAAELGHRKIRVNAINPGMIDTEGVRTAGISEGDLRKQVEQQTPLGRIGQPGDIGTVASFLASDEAGWVTGQTLHVAGGYRS